MSDRAPTDALDHGNFLFESERLRLGEYSFEYAKAPPGRARAARERRGRS